MATLRLATKADLPDIVRIYNQIVPGRMVTADTEPVTVESRRPWFHAHPVDTRPIWVATDRDRIIGWLSVDTFYARAAYDGTAMIALYVDESQRQQGLGKQLLEQAIRAAPALGLHTLLGYIFAHNEPSLRFFEKQGFMRWAHLPRVAVLDGVERDLIIVGRRLS